MTDISPNTLTQQLTEQRVQGFRVTPAWIRSPTATTNRRRQKSSVCQFQGLESRAAGTAGLVSPLSWACRWLPCHCALLHTIVPLSASTLCPNLCFFQGHHILHTGLGPTHGTSFYLNHPIKCLTFKYSHILRCQVGIPFNVPFGWGVV